MIIRRFSHKKSPTAQAVEDTVFSYILLVDSP